MARLKPCPFCGEKPADCFPWVSKMTNGTWNITHFCETLRRLDGKHGVSIDVYAETKAAAIKKWNTRGGKKEV